MRSPLSSPSCIFSCFTPPCAPRTPVVQRGSRAIPRSLWSPEFMPPKRTFVPGQVSSPGVDSDSVLLARETTHCRASRLAASRVGASRPRTQGRARDACDRLLYVSAHVSPWSGAGRSTIICIRPLAIRRSLVPGRPFCHAVASRPTRLCFDRPDQSSARRCRRLPCFDKLSSSGRVLHLFAWGSGVGSAGVQPARNTQADGAPKVPGAGGNRLRRRLS
jgi:hypothetical protein